MGFVVVGEFAEVEGSIDYLVLVGGDGCGGGCRWMVYSLKSPVCGGVVSDWYTMLIDGECMLTRWCSGSRVSECMPDQPRF